MLERKDVYLILSYLILYSAIYMQNSPLIVFGSNICIVAINLKM